MRKHIPILLVAVLFMVSCSGSDRTPDRGKEVAERPTCTAPEAELRRPISRDNPLFIFNVYGGPEEVLSVDAVLPADVRPFFALHYIPPEPYDHSEAFRARVEAVLDAAEEIGFPTFIQTEHCYTRNETPQSYWAGLFERYSSLVGLLWAEISCTGLQLTGLDDDYMERMKATIETVAACGGYFLWQDMGWDRPLPREDRPFLWQKVPHVFVKAGADQDLYRTIRENAAHVIIMDKHNGDGKRLAGPSAAMGLWAVCQVGQWGVNPEDWMWKEAGYARLFEPACWWCWAWGLWAELFGGSWASIFTYPDALFGMEWLMAAAGGATTFSLEAPFHGFASLGTGRTTPAFDNVLLPLIRMILSHGLIPTREEVREKMKIAYQPTHAVPPELNFDDLFKGLYGPEERSWYEWLPSTGRYYFLPILPVLAGPEVAGLFPTVFDDVTYAEELADTDRKRAFFDARYPSTGKGDSWFVNLGDRWFFANPNENRDVTTTFSFAPGQPSGGSLSGSLSPHTFGICIEEKGRLRIHLSNYRIDSEVDVWSDPDLVNEDPMGYVDNIYIPDPTDEALRRTVLRIEGLDAEPGLDITGHDGFECTTSFRAEPGTYELEIDHNGPVDLTVVMP